MRNRPGIRNACSKHSAEPRVRLIGECRLGDVSLVPVMSPRADDYRLPKSEDFEQQPADERCHTCSC